MFNYDMNLTLPNDERIEQMPDPPSMIGLALREELDSRTCRTLFSPLFLRPVIDPQRSTR
jgi:hypothetical protein